MRPLDFQKKRAFDFSLACFGLLFLFPLIIACWWLARRDTDASGFFRQTRVGQGGKTFQVIKLRTMYAHKDGSTVTTRSDTRITPLGAKFRRWKLDELPQLINVVKGEMSFVGPRPDVPGFLDTLQGDDQRLWRLKPGITGPATLRYRNEEELLDAQQDPEKYNKEVIWPDKVRINLAYMEGWSLGRDLGYILQTIRRS